MDAIESSPIHSSLKMEPDVEHQQQSSLGLPSSSPEAAPPPSAQPRTSYASSSAYNREESRPARDGTQSSGSPVISQRGTQGGHRDTSRARSSAKPQSISELAETPFEQFDSNEEIGRPFHQSISDDADFQRELTTRLVSVILETHAWMSSRPRFERDNQLVRLTDDIKRIQDVEEQQGMSSSSHRPSGSRSRPISTSSFSPQNYEPEPGGHGDVSTAHLMAAAREKLVQFVRHFTTAIQALAQGFTLQP
ncbi:hypothetical protein DFP72DRAFT_107398 [Ephemerocybe angulata]|uniref:Uncharacterized protein n=1 Tax=Ephemerocybe angulata TaxID=980116 RepID=A0A8H6HDI5_9AGAR|nr:hypothetical protein DFP72DRAFT_107398 [Tulosesus angulatus]